MPDVKMPQLGESVTEGTLGKWLKKVGEEVHQYEPLAEVITDKVNAEIPSDFDGVLVEILANEGDTVKVGTVICRVADAGGAGAPAPSTAAGAAVGAAGVDTGHGGMHGPQAGTVVNGADAATTAAVSHPHGRFSPAVLKLADEHGIDLSKVSGTGENGRITRKDVLLYVESASQGQGAARGAVTGGEAAAAAQARPQPSESRTAAPVPSQPAAPTVLAAAASTSLDEEVIVPSAVRKTIARRMVESKHQAPHAWTMVEADVSSLVTLRTGVKADFKRKEGIDLTYMPFFIKAVVEGLKQYPMLNGAWINEEIHLKKHINISMAVATDDALVVPVIHDADRLSIAGLAHAVNDLAARARSGRLTLSDVQGGTFTVDNTGAFGSIASQPIINSPQAAIITMEAIVKRAVVVHDAIAIRSMVNLCLSLDHRILDGWVTGQFMKVVKARLESFNRDTVIY